MKMTHCQNRLPTKTEGKKENIYTKHQKIKVGTFNSLATNKIKKKCYEENKILTLFCKDLLSV